jgi:hypothetical protein
MVNNRLGPVMTVTKMEIHKDYILLFVLPDNKNAPLIEMGDNQFTNDVFLSIVKEFLNNNNIEFVVGNKFESQTVHTFIPAQNGEWAFKIYGHEESPEEYFINNL